MTKVYRPGAIGALMDEYERAASELKKLIKKISDEDYVRIFDTNTKDESCRSVQTIMSHVVYACHGYANYIRKVFSMQTTRRERKLLSKEEVIEKFDAAMAYTVETLEDKWLLSDRKITSASIKSGWGVTYDMEQMLEHAIVHILRHRRQIERFLASGNSN